eukprot:6295101-Prymnesium_polylepis.1
MVAIEAAVAKQRGAQDDIQVLSRAPCDMAQCRTAGQIRSYERDLRQRDERLGQPLGERHRSLCSDEVPIEAATSTEGQ